MISFHDESKINAAAFHYYKCLVKLRAYVNDNYSSKITVGDAAGVMGMERTYCSRFFREKVGVSFTVWLSLIRLRAAITHIEKHDCTISEAAYEVGFGDVRTFERHFKKQTNITPREYTQHVRRALDRKIA